MKQVFNSTTIWTNSKEELPKDDSYVDLWVYYRTILGGIEQRIINCKFYVNDGFICDGRNVEKYFETDFIYWSYTPCSLFTFTGDKE